MKRILFAGLVGAMLVGQIKAATEKKYIGTYYQLLGSSQLTGPERIDFSKAKTLEGYGKNYGQPGLQWIGTSVNVKKGHSSAIAGTQLDRRGTMLKFDILAKTSGPGWNIEQGTDSSGMPKFTLCIDQKFFLPGNLAQKGWGPQHTGEITTKNGMVCFDLIYEAKPIEYTKQELLDLQTTNQ